MIISSRFLHEATNLIWSRFLGEATGCEDIARAHLKYGYISVIAKFS